MMSNCKHEPCKTFISWNESHVSRDFIIQDVLFAQTTAEGLDQRIDSRTSDSIRCTSMISSFQTVIKLTLQIVLDMLQIVNYRAIKEGNVNAFSQMSYEVPSTCACLKCKGFITHVENS